MQIEVYHDTACPWCRIGKRNLSSALAQWTGEPVTVHYRTFFLNDAIPPEGHDFREYMRAKGGGNPDLEMWFDGPRRAGAAVGLTFRFERIGRAPNTLLSHRLIALAPEVHRPQVVDAIYDAYFEHGEDIGSLDVLVRLAAAQGLDGDAIRAQLEGDAAREQVLAEAYEGQLRGVSGVPLFVFNGRYGLSGAQPPQVILQVMHQVAAQPQP